MAEVVGDGAYRVLWTVDAKKLKGSDRTPRHTQRNM